MPKNKKKKGTGAVLAMGTNYLGSLGLGPLQSSVASPTSLQIPSNVREVVSGYLFGMLILSKVLRLHHKKKKERN